MKKYYEYFVTFSRGFEIFLEDELKKLNVSYEFRDGKVIIRSDKEIAHSLVKLDFSEREFILISEKQIEEELNRENLVENFQNFMSEINLEEKLDAFLLKNHSELSKRHKTSHNIQLFVKLRPKFLIRHTERIRKIFYNAFPNVNFSEQNENQLSFILSNNCFYVLLLLKKNQSNLPLRRNTCLALLSKLKPGKFLLDPFVGNGGIINCSLDKDKFTFTFLCDCNQELLLRLGQSLKFSNLGIIQCSATNIPLRSGTIDAICTDFPFNIKHVIKHEKETNLVKFYKACFSEFHSCLSKFGQYSVLLSKEGFEQSKDEIIASTPLLKDGLSFKTDLKLGKTSAKMLFGHRL